MNYDHVNTPYDRNELAALSAFELCEEQKDEIVAVCSLMGVSIGQFAAVLASFPPKLGLGTHAPRPELRDSYVLPAPFSVAHAEHRRRSMGMPTGKPWDR